MLAGARAQPPRILVVEDEDHVVRGKPEVAFDTRANLQRSGEGEQAVSGKGRTIVEPAVGEARQAGIERISA